jgi:hypothetical protein
MTKKKQIDNKFAERRIRLANEDAVTGLPIHIEAFPAQESICEFNPSMTETG